MPVYEYECGACEGAFEKRLPMSQYDDPQDCPSCGSGNTERVVSMTNFVLKGDGWTGKNGRISRQMAHKNRRLDRKTNEMKQDAPVVTLAPNVDGERVGSWSEAQKLAASKGKNAASYTDMVRKEKASGGTT